MGPQQHQSSPRRIALSTRARSHYVYMSRQFATRLECKDVRSFLLLSTTLYFLPMADKFGFHDFLPGVFLALYFE